jgi:hypothetical protein
MSYFNQFNSVLYPDFTKATGEMILKNITSRVVRRENLVDDKSVFYTYTMREEESIEDVSNKLYGSPEFYWTIMIINNRFDRFYDFPLPVNVVNEYITEKYGSLLTAIQTMKYYIRPDKLLYSTNSELDKSFFIEVPFGTYTNWAVSEAGIPMRREVSMYDYELEQNELKRNILVLQNNYLPIFVKNFENLIS